jgi:hypothetical protein
LVLNRKGWHENVGLFVLMIIQENVLNHQTQSLETKAEQVGEYRRHAIRVVVGYDFAKDRYVINAYVTYSEDDARTLEITDLYADEIGEAFQMGWAAVDGHFSQQQIGRAGV